MFKSPFVLLRQADQRLPLYWQPLEKSVIGGGQNQTGQHKSLCWLKVAVAEQAYELVQASPIGIHDSPVLADILKPKLV